MKLKSLEIEGFKSFPNKTLLVFDNNMTGVVGPNGCGKSNIVDAIRWVMGEQSAKHLRGKHMEDVIFAGARDRGPSSVSSVELTFSPDGYQTPPQYANCKEISVGRKLYRTGESEYFINKQAARLKDIKDLFLGTGAGVHAYSIIEQGSIGQMVMSKPEERRKIIEEAAGISKFQLRKEAAQRRMEATNQNLLRLKDILSEMERQKASLERQAKKAEKFKQIRDELQDLDLILAAIDFDKLNSRQENLLTKIKELDGKFTESEALLQESENDFETRRLELAELESEVQSLQQSVYEWENTLNIAESRLQTKKENVQRLQNEIQEGKSRLKHNQKELELVEVELEDVVKNSVQADLNHFVLEDNVVELEARYLQTQDASRGLFEELEDARHAYHHSSKKLVEIAGRKETLQHRLEELETRKTANREEIEEISSRQKELSKVLKDSQEGLAEVKQMKLTLNERSVELSDHLSVVEEQLNTEKNNLESIKEKLLQKKSRLHSLEELERNFEGYQDGPKAVLEKKRSGEMEYVLGAVADFIETQPEFENAVSAVLGESAQSVVVRTQQESMHCAEYLKTVDSGRGSFIAMTMNDEPVIQKRIVSENQTFFGFKGYISDFVQAKQGYEKLKQLLFADYALVENLSQALEFWQQHQHPVATLEGEVINSQGVISGGSLEKTSKALLEKKREIKDLQAEISHIINDVKAKEEICFDLNRKLKMLRQELEQMKASCHEEELKIASQEKDIVHAGREVETLNQRKNKLSQSLMQIEDTLNDLNEKLQELHAEEIQQNEIHAEAEKLLEEKKSEEEYYQKKLTEEQELLTQSKIQLTQAKEQKAFYEKEIERLSATLLQLKKAIINSDEKTALLIKKQLFLKDRIAFAEKNLTKILEKKSAVDEAYQLQKDKFEALDQHILEKEVQLKTLRKESAQLKDEINQDTLALTELRNQLSRLKEQIFERYQLSLSEVYQEYLQESENMAEFDYADKSTRAEELRKQMAKAGHVNLDAIDELNEVTERFDFLKKQKEDLEQSLSALEQAIQKINETTKIRFKETFDLVNQKFSELFPKLFEGGEAHLRLTDPDNILETGVDIFAQPPGKKLQSITLLSGGEKALTAVSLLFAIFLIKPSPFCLLDEVDAPLDDANVDRYNEIVREMSQRTQFIVITHNKRTMQVTDVLYGVTMEKSGISQIVSVALD